jgi:hypothetical protein
LQAALRADGVPADVEFFHQPLANSGLLPPHCHLPSYVPPGTYRKLMPQITPWGPGPNNVALIIDPAYIPHGDAVYIEAFTSPSTSGTWFSMDSGLVVATPQCIGS